MKRHFTLEERLRYLIDKACTKVRPTQKSIASELLLEAIKQAEHLHDNLRKTYYFNEIADACLELNLSETCLEVLNRGLALAQSIC